MNPKIVYPIPKRQSLFYKDLRNIARIVFIVASIVCLIVNTLIKGKPWSLIVLWSLFLLWRIVFSFKLVEFSFYSYFVRIIIHIVILLVLIDKCLSPGWASLVVPIVLFCCLLIMFIYFFVAYDRKQRHLMSVVFLGIISIIQIVYFNHTLQIENILAFVFQVATFILFLILLISNWKDLLIEIKARFMIND